VIVACKRLASQNLVFLGFQVLLLGRDRNLNPLPKNLSKQQL